MIGTTIQTSLGGILPTLPLPPRNPWILVLTWISIARINFSLFINLLIFNFNKSLESYLNSNNLILIKFFLNKN